MDETPIMIKIDDLRHTLDLSMPSGALFDLPLDEERMPLFVDRLRDFGATRVVLDAPEGLEHPFAAALREAGLMVAAGNIQPC